MDKNKKCHIRISVVIPVYNGEETVRRCLESVKQQSLSKLEILCVDDGSEDNSVSIVEEEATKDGRIHLFKQKNKGAWAARNVGIDNAKGEYIAFLDCDDVFCDVNSLEVLYNKAYEKSANLCAGKMVSFAHGKELRDYTKHITEDVEQFVPFEEHQDSLGFTSFIYRRDFLKGNDIKFPRLRYYEDPVFLLNALKIANGFLYVPVPLYEVIGHNDATSLSGDRITDFLKGVIEQMYIAAEGNYQLLFQRLLDTLCVDCYMQLMHNLTAENLKLLLKIGEICKKCNYELKLLEDVKLGAAEYAENRGGRAFPRKLSREFEWLENNKDVLSSYFKERNISKVLIYGLGHYGYSILRLLDKTDVEVVAGVDQNVSRFMGLSIVRPSDIFPAHDAIIVAMAKADDVMQLLAKREEKNVYLLTDIVNDLCC